MRLKTDIISVFKNHVYGKAGEEVKVISEHGEVFIVENKKGIRYPVKKENLECI